MKAITVHSFDDGGALHLVDLPDPVPGAGQTLIEVEATGVGYVDVMSRRGQYPGFPEPGFVPGLEVAGVVRGTGERVYAMLGGGGGYAELAVADDVVVELPPEVSPAQAVALGANALTASLLLDRAGVAPGESVLVRGASGGVGLMAAQVAAHLGAEVTASTRSAAHAGRLAELGFSTRDGEDASYDVVVDPVAGAELGRHLGRLRPDGRYVVCGAAGGLPAPDFAAGLVGLFPNSPSLLMFSLSSVGPERLRSGLKTVFDLAARGVLRGVADAAVPLAQASLAHERLESGTVFGKVILRP
ncbi:oxidoreductase [Planomonospora parontospora subsp. parontospora]|uniref:Oxidoreductase n=2 Tax=Planomonospora parontospora TaxID=58119 RepID=A0AA37BFD7_9ACTN|nr:zinc-binding dehydrogenase [Planomonospora parontospora]GGK62136.1 oxidoreductase [Planomonospora parontospora]GII12313.1 oxidoreductase [Planomonospora parontospora subsp. parontospora]